MGLKALLERLQTPAADTPDTPQENTGYQRKPSIHAGCTPDTPETPHFADSHVTAEAEPDRWCWPHSAAMNTGEIDTFMERLIHFTSRSASGAEAIADALVQRDRQGDDRRLCVECAHCRPGPRCSHGLAVLDVLQRCDHFAIDRSVADLGQCLAAGAEPIEFQPDEDPHD